MRPFDFETDAAHIRDAVDELQAAWRSTSEQWNDGVSRRFCEQRLEPLGATFKLALDAVGRMGQLVDQMRRDCQQ
ncbi:MAG: hypothetical protein AAF961_11990 [Planctomycetota bacterium]